MPYKCCVDKCRGNYKDGPKVTAFSFPKDENLRKRWLTAINKPNYVPTSHTKVCELHFQESKIERMTSVVDSKTGTLLTAPLIRPRLIKGAIPNQFPESLKYIPKRRIRVRKYSEIAEDPLAVTEFVEIDSESRTFYSIDELRSKLEYVELGDWIVSCGENCVYFFCMVEEASKPFVKYFIRVKEDLVLSLFSEDVEINSIPDHKYKFPMAINTISDINQVLCVLSQFAVVKEENSVEQDLQNITKSLEALLPKMQNKKGCIECLIDQVKLLSLYPC